MTETHEGRSAAVVEAAAPPEGLLEKLQRLRDRLQGVHERAREAQVASAVMSAALAQALAGRERGRDALRRELLAGRRRAAGAPPSGRGARLGRLIDRVLLKLKFPGRALIIARSGLWRPAAGGVRGRLSALRQMAGYARRGPNRLVQPRALFDQAWYLAEDPALAGTGWTPLVHYLLIGDREGRAPHPLFHPAHYRSVAGEAVAASGLTSLQHYVRHGARAGLSPHPLFDVGHYLSQYPGASEAMPDPLAHYLEHGWREGVSPHPLFDPRWYARWAPDLEVPPLVHYLTVGAWMGLSPHPLFDPVWYRAQHPDVAAAGVEPLTHFLMSGGAEGRSPSPFFDSAHYLARRGGASVAANPLLDYLWGGAWEVGEPRPGFWTTTYIAAFPEIVIQGLTPLEHWARAAADGGADT